MEKATSLSECYLTKNRPLSQAAHIGEVCSHQRKPVHPLTLNLESNPIRLSHQKSSIHTSDTIYPDGWLGRPKMASWRDPEPSCGPRDMGEATASG